MPLTLDPNFIDFDEQPSAPATPPTDAVRLYAKADKKLYRKDDTGTETELGGGGFTSFNVEGDGGAPLAIADADTLLTIGAGGIQTSTSVGNILTIDGANAGRVGHIASGNLTGSSVTISSIPSIYTHLRLYIYSKSSNATEDFLAVRVGNSGVDNNLINYARSSINVAGTVITGLGDNAAAANILTNCSVALVGVTLRFSSTIVDFGHYKEASTFKIATYVHKASIGTGASDQKYVTGGGHWLNNTAGIDTIGISLGFGSFTAGSKYSLIGIIGE